jgi:hypothetical protein
MGIFSVDIAHFLVNKDVRTFWSLALLPTYILGTLLNLNRALWRYH